MARTTGSWPSAVDRQTTTAFLTEMARPDVAIERGDRMCETRTEGQLMAAVAANPTMLGTIGGAVPPAEDQQPSADVPGRAVTVLIRVQALGLAAVSEGEMSVDRQAGAEPTPPRIEMVVQDQPHEARDVLRNEGGVRLPRRIVVVGPLSRAEPPFQGADDVPAATGARICDVTRWIAVNSGWVIALPGDMQIEEIKAAAVGGSP